MEYEDVVTIATPEGVELELALAGLGSRSVAGSVDLLLKFLLIVALAILTLGFWGGGFGAAAFSAAAFVAYVGYDIAFEVLGGGRTPGKRASGLRVVADDGGPVDLRRSAVRNLVRVIDGPGSLYFIGSVAILLTARNQRLGDLAAGTLVVRERRAADRFVRSSAPRATAPAGAFDVSAVTTTELATVRRFLERRIDLDGGARAGLATQLAARLRPKVVGAPEAEPEDFLEWLASAKASRG